ncbi:MAG: GldG family protein [Clostridiales bacterium]|jgi:ABC-2 type transport system permease protein|nr:GldG family protein [Clostridiales bacterium]
MLSFNENELEKDENNEVNNDELKEKETVENTALPDSETAAASEDEDSVISEKDITNGESTENTVNAESVSDTETALDTEAAASEENNEKAESGSGSADKRKAKRQERKAKRLAERISFKSSFKTRSTKAGTYMFTVCAIAVAAVIILNMIVGKLPSSIKHIDTTGTDIYSISDYSKQIVKNIDTKVTVYLVAKKGNEDMALSTLLDRYAGLNSNIKVEQKDPELSLIADKYSEGDLEENSLIFVSDKRSKTVDYSSLYEYSETAQQNYYYYGDQVQADIFDGENEITSALSYVTTDILPKVYSLTGHGEEGFSDSVLSYIVNENIELDDIDVLKAKQIPDDCECLIISDPSKDISTDEKDIILDYLGGGGNLLIMTSYKDNQTPNLEEVLENYGVQKQKGVIIEDDPNCYYYYYNYLMPNIQSHEVTDPILDSGYRVLMPMAHGIAETDLHRGSLELTSLLTTSKSAYAKDNPTEEDFAKTDDDIGGPFSVGYSVSEVHGETETRVVWFSTTYFLDDSYLGYTGNINLFLNSLKWMCKLEKNISVIEPKVLVGTEKLEITSGEGVFWNIMFVGVLPAASIFIGLAIWIRRKKR